MGHGLGAPTREQAFSAAFPSLLALAYRVAYRILGNPDDARDIAAETLARAYARWDRLQDGAGPWVVTVSGRAAIDLLRRRATSRRHAPALADRTPDPQPEQRLDLQAALLALPRRQREVVVLRYLADRSESETARVLGLSPGTVKSHSSRGLTALRAALGPAEGGR